MFYFSFNFSRKYESFSSKLSLSTWTAGLGDPGPVMELTQDVGVALGHALGPGHQEAVAGVAVLVEVPAVGAVVGVLGQGGGHHGGQGEEGELHDASSH